MHRRHHVRENAISFKAMSWTDALLLVGGGLFAGFINTVAGGGSLLTLPLLIFLGLPSAEANGSNRVALLLQNLFAIHGFRSKGYGVQRFSLTLGVVAVIGSIIGAQIAVDMTDRAFNRILAIVMILVLSVTLLKPLLKIGAQVTNPPNRVKPVTVIAFFLIGIYGGFIQAGVGFLIISTLALLHGFALSKINAIKVFVIFSYTIAAIVIFLLNDKVNWAYGLTLAVGNSTGAYFTSRWSVSVPERWIRWLLTIAVTSLAIKLWFF